MATDLATYLSNKATGTPATASSVNPSGYSWTNPYTNFNWGLVPNVAGSGFGSVAVNPSKGDWFTTGYTPGTLSELNTTNSLFGLYGSNPGISSTQSNVSWQRSTALGELESLYNLYKASSGQTNANDKYALSYDPATNRWAYSTGGWTSTRDGMAGGSIGTMYYLPTGMDFGTYLNYLKTGQVPTTTTNPVTPTDPTDPTITQLQELVAQLQAQLASNTASVEAEAAKAEAEKQARIADRTQALQSAGLWDLVQQLYGDNADDLNSYLDTGVFTRQTGLEDWANENLTGLSESLNQQYANAMKQLQQQAAGAGFGDASWIKGAETALRGQQRGLADLYGSSYDAAALASLLGMDPSYIRGQVWNAPQPISDYGTGFDAFAALDPTLSTLIPGGIDENALPWITLDYEKKNPWASIFGADGEASGKRTQLSGLIRSLLGA